MNQSSLLMMQDYFYLLPLEPHDITHWPTFNEIIQNLQKISLKHELMVLDDVIIFYPKKIKSEITQYAAKNGSDILVMNNLLVHRGRVVEKLVKELKQKIRL